MVKFVTRSSVLLIVGLGVGLAIGAGVVFTLRSSPKASSSDLKVLVVDQQAVLRNSLAGQDIARQATVLRDQISGEVQAEQNAIINAEKDLSANGQVYSPAQRDDKLKALDARRRAYPEFEQRKSEILQMSITNASNKVAAALRPILQTLIDQNKATLLLDRGQVMYAAPSYDVTDDAIKRLNAVLTTVKVERVNLDSVSSTGGDQAPSGDAHATAPAAPAPASAAPPEKVPAPAPVTATPKTTN